LTFADEDRKRLTDTLQHEDTAEIFFKRNRQKISRDKKNLGESLGGLIDMWSQNRDGSVKSREILHMLSIIIPKTFGTLSDLLDIIEISLLQNIEARKQIEELTNIMTKSGGERERMLIEFSAKLNNRERELSDISKHKQNFEWLDKYFKEHTNAS
jgi:predicted DNA-binding ArsR family transcriptional regulator